MICTSVVACLSSGFAEIKKIVSIFVNFHKFFGYFESSAFFSKNGGSNFTQNQSSRMFAVNF